MVYRIIGGIFIVLLAVSLGGWAAVSDNLLGVLGVIAGVALLAGI